jgi:hypothetical protein
VLRNVLNAQHICTLADTVSIAFSPGVSYVVAQVVAGASAQCETWLAGLGIDHPTQEWKKNENVLHFEHIVHINGNSAGREFANAVLFDDARREGSL